MLIHYFTTKTRILLLNILHYVESEIKAIVMKKGQKVKKSLGWAGRAICFPRETKFETNSRL